VAGSTGQGRFPGNLGALRLGLGAASSAAASWIVAGCCCGAIVANLFFFFFLGAYRISTGKAQDMLGAAAARWLRCCPSGAPVGWTGRLLGGPDFAAWTRGGPGARRPVTPVAGEPRLLAAVGFGAAQAPVRAQRARAHGSWPGRGRHGAHPRLAATGRPTARHVPGRGPLFVAGPRWPRISAVTWLGDVTCGRATSRGTDPVRHYANFVVADGPSGVGPGPMAAFSPQLTSAAGPGTYQVGRATTILVWNTERAGPSWNRPGLELAFAGLRASHVQSAPGVWAHHRQARAGHACGD